MMSSLMVVYKAELNQRYWEYQRSYFPAWQKYFDQPQAKGSRPPVFRTSEAWRNILTNPKASQDETEMNATQLFKREGRGSSRL
jgi:hypothetical protein